MTEPDWGAAVDDDVQWCHTAVQRVSRTFAITVAELEAPMSDYICVGYLLCRIADTIEDASHIPPESKAQLLGHYRDVLDPDRPTTAEEFATEVASWRPEDLDDDWRVVARTPRVVRAFDRFDAETRAAMRPSIVEMVGGMQEFVRRYAPEGGIRIETMAELEEYCWYVAGTVSTLVTNLFAPTASEDEERILRENAEDFSLLLQLVNVAKDARTDYREENNTYVPRSLLDRHGLEAADVDDPERAAEFAPVIRAVATRAEGYADGAQAWIEAIPDAQSANRSAWAIPFLLAVATIRELRSRPADVVAEGELKVDREEVVELLERVHTGERSIADLRHAMRHRPLQEH